MDNGGVVLGIFGIPSVLPIKQVSLFKVLKSSVGSWNLNRTTLARSPHNESYDKPTTLVG